MKNKLVNLALSGSLVLSPLVAQENKPDNFYKGLEIAHVGLSMADYFSTMEFIKNGGREMNPLANKFLDTSLKFGLFKTGMTAFALYSGREMYKENPKKAKRQMIFANLLYGLVINNNINISINLKRRQNR